MWVIYAVRKREEYTREKFAFVALTAFMGLTATVVTSIAYCNGDQHDNAEIRHSGTPVTLIIGKSNSKRGIMEQRNWRRCHLEALNRSLWHSASFIGMG